MLKIPKKCVKNCKNLCSKFQKGPVKLLQLNKLRQNFVVTLKTAYKPIDRTTCWESSPDGDGYLGDISVTLTGKTCQKWNTNNPHSVNFMPYDGPNHNHCRLPGI